MPNFLPGLVADFRCPFLSSGRHRPVPGPSSLEPFRCDGAELGIEREHKRERRSARSLIPASVRIELDEVEVDPASVRSICLIHVRRRSSREGKAGRKSQSFLRSGQHIIELPFVETQLCSREPAYAVDQAENSVTVSTVRNRAHVVEGPCRRFRMDNRDNTVLPYREPFVELRDCVYLAPRHFVAIDIPPTH